MTTKDQIRVALEALKTVVELAVTKPDGTQYAYLETRNGSFVHVAKALEQAEAALSQPAVDEDSGKLVDDALAKVSELGTVGAMKWLAASLSRPADVRRAAMLKCAAACDARADDHDNGVFNNFRVKKRDEARACAAAIRALAQKEAGNG
jgi:hypothetical protein